MKITWIGTPGDQTDSIEQFGVEFERGKAVEVDDAHPKADKFRNNPTFTSEASEAKEAAAADEEAEKAELRKFVSENGGDVDGRSSLATLRKRRDEILLSRAKERQDQPVVEDPSSR